MTALTYWNYPTEIFCGEGAIDQLVKPIRLAGCSKPLLVVDPGLLDLPPFGRVTGILERVSMRFGVFHAISGNPKFEEAKAGATTFIEGGYDCLIALGGGSAIDAAKAIALLSRDADGIEKFEWSRIVEHYPTLMDFPKLDAPPLIVAPTTAGTGSELGRETVLTDAALGIKKVIGHRELLPRCVLLDPALTVSMPAALTASTGMDALTHHIESLFSPLYHPMSAGVATEGVRLVNDYLARAVADGSDLEARQAMLVASASAAVAFQKGLGGVHAIAHPVGARHKLHHGLLNGVLLPYVLVANRQAIESRAAILARYLDLPSHSFDGLMRRILDLNAEIGVPHSLAALGLDGLDAEWVGEQALADLSSSDTNSIPLTAAQYADIYRRAVAGDLDWRY